MNCFPASGIFHISNQLPFFYQQKKFKWSRSKGRMKSGKEADRRTESCTMGAYVGSSISTQP